MYGIGIKTNTHINRSDSLETIQIWPINLRQRSQEYMNTKGKGKSLQVVMGKLDSHME